MFEESLVESTSLLRSRNRWPALCAFAIEAAIASALIAFPVLHPEILPVSVPRLTLFAPLPVVRPTPPPLRLRVETPVASGANVAAPMQEARISQSGLQSDARGLDRPELALGVNLMGAGSSPLTALGSGPAANVMVRSSGATSAGPLNVSTGVMAGRLLEPIRPQYPAIARITRSEGTVVVKAVISKTGMIESAHVVSGPAVLQEAALDAVRGARYRPYLLNGQVTDVETTISIVFRMGS
jgi:protein TonB